MPPIPRLKKSSFLTLPSYVIGISNTVNNKPKSGYVVELPFDFEPHPNQIVYVEFGVYVDLIPNAVRFKDGF